MFVMAFALLLGSCERKSKQDVLFDVESFITNDMNYMSENYGNNFCFYETTVGLNDWIDEECDGTFIGVTNVFQYFISDTGDSFEAKVVQFNHVGKELDIKVIDGFWLEDFDINRNEIKISYKEAFDRMISCRYEKPHSRFCVLRKPIGPYPCNPQYIFGNAHTPLIFVDATTGQVRDYDPAFTKRE